MMRQHRVVVVDDDVFLRAGARDGLRRHREIAEPSIHTLAEARGFEGGYWALFDTLLIDVHDEREETDAVGTDVYGGGRGHRDDPPAGAAHPGSWPSPPPAATPC